jgi:cytochrome c oxidase subunit III
MAMGPPAPQRIDHRSMQEFIISARITPFSDRRKRFRAGRLGMRLFLASLTMLFGGSLLGFIVIRVQMRHYWPDLPPLPKLLWLSTFILIISSISMQWALEAVKRDRQQQLRTGMIVTTLLGVAFLTVQVRCWLTWLAPVSQQWRELSEFRLALTGFYVLTVLHALHVIGGLIPMTITARHASAGFYSSDDHAPVHYCAMYWHFLDAVWMVLFALLMLGS